MSRSKLEKTVSDKLNLCLSGITVLKNTRPDWLVSSQGERLELDFYIPEVELAIEVQGQQHYTFTPYFHQNQHAFTNQLRRDREKRNICDRKGIALMEIASASEIDSLIAKIIDLLPKVETDKEFAARMKEYNANTSIMDRRKLKIKKNERKLFFQKMHHLNKINGLLKNENRLEEHTVNLRKKAERIQMELGRIIRKAKNV